MQRFIRALLCIALSAFALDAFAAVAFVQAKSTGMGAGSVTSIAATFSAAVTSGNAVVGVAAVGNSNPSALSTITDDKGNNYTIVRKTADATNGELLATFYLLNITNAPTVITANFSGTESDSGISMMEVSGVATSSALDVETGQVEATPGTGTDALNSTAVTTTTAGQFIFAGAVRTGNRGGGSAEFTPGTGFTEPANAEWITNGHIALSSEYQIQGSAGSIDGTFTVVTNDGHIAMIETFKAAGGAVVVPQALHHLIQQTIQ